MAPKVICAKCKQIIRENHYLKCAICKLTFDLSCTNKEKLYNLMSKERKNSWTCDKCKCCKPRKSSTPKLQKVLTAHTSNTGTTDNVRGELGSEERLTPCSNATPPQKDIKLVLNSSSENITLRQYKTLLILYQKKIRSSALIDVMIH